MFDIYIFLSALPSWAWPIFLSMLGLCWCLLFIFEEKQMMKGNNDHWAEWIKGEILEKKQEGDEENGVEYTLKIRVYHRSGYHIVYAYKNIFTTYMYLIIK